MPPPRPPPLRVPRLLRGGALAFQVRKALAAARSVQPPSAPRSLRCIRSVCSTWAHQPLSACRTGRCAIAATARFSCSSATSRAAAMSVHWRKARASRRRTQPPSDAASVTSAARRARMWPLHVLKARPRPWLERRDAAVSAVAHARLLSSTTPRQPSKTDVTRRISQKLSAWRILPPTRRSHTSNCAWRRRHCACSRSARRWRR